jgi:hypothetical protein
MLSFRLTAATVLLLGSATASIADDWTAMKLRGPVFQYVDNQWIKLERGTIVPDDRPIQTLGDGHVVFTRGKETIDVGPATQIRILDRGTTAKPATTVNQYFGTVSIEAQVENVQHFTVQTSYLAAVVKGTKFTVSSSKTGTDVSVERGHVAVEDRHDHTHVLLAVGQSAGVDIRNDDKGIIVSGDGELPAIVSSSVALPLSPPSEEGGPKGPAKSAANNRDKDSYAGGKGLKTAGETDNGDGKSQSSNSNGKSESSNGNQNGNSSKGNSDHGNSATGTDSPGNGNSGNVSSDNGNGGSGNCNGKGNKNR